MSFRRKYSTPAEISAKGKEATLPNELAALYYVNADMIEANKWLRDEILARQAAVNNRLVMPGAEGAQAFENYK